MKTNSDTLLISVIYHGVERYLSDYCNSIEFQDTNDFDVLILNDGYSGIFPLDSSKIHILNIENRFTPAEIRMLGIRYALENDYKYVVFTDTDDYFSSNRISLSKEKLRKNDFVYNELDLINKNRIVISKSYSTYLKLKDECSSYLDLIDKNLFGLSNTGVKVKNLEKIYIPKEIIAVDWWIFSILLLNGCVGGFIKDATTYYRQYNDNLIGVGKKIDEDRLVLGIQVKEIHYKNLLLYCEQHGLYKAKGIYKQKFSEIIELREKLQDNEFRIKYIRVINKNYSKIINGWWSDILSLKEWRKYNE